MTSDYAFNNNENVFPEAKFYLRPKISGEIAFQNNTNSQNFARTTFYSYIYILRIIVVLLIEFIYFERGIVFPTIK